MNISLLKFALLNQFQDETSPIHLIIDKQSIRNEPEDIFINVADGLFYLQLKTDYRVQINKLYTNILFIENEYDIPPRTKIYHFENLANMLDNKFYYEELIECSDTHVR